jgi:cell wall-associated NlpC family hydrolase
LATSFSMNEIPCERKAVRASSHRGHAGTTYSTTSSFAAIRFIALQRTYIMHQIPDVMKIGHRPGMNQMITEEKTDMNRTKITLSLLLAGFALLASTPSKAQQDYVSPYSISLTAPMEELLAPDQAPPRNDWHLEAAVPYEDWYSRQMRKDNGAWGPRPRLFPALAEESQAPLSWKRQRVLAVAYKYIGLPYQHHHIPDWDPPQGWPWKQVAFGRNSKGVDCSDFTSWIYNYGLGIKLDTGIREQADTEQIGAAGGDGSIQVKIIRDEAGYDELIHKLKTGDLLYIKNDKGVVAHVIMWVGEHGRSPDGAPLIIDCTGSDHRDSNGNQIPIGVRLRPFLPNEWYYKSFSHAHRVLHESAS